MSDVESRLEKLASQFDPTKSKNKPIRAQCISTYLAMADDGLIVLEHGEYEFYKLRLIRLAHRMEKHKLQSQHPIRK